MAQDIYNGFLMGGEFKDYLDKTGVNDALGDILKRLKDEPVWPQNPQEYIRKELALLCGAPADPLVDLKETYARLAKVKKENGEEREKLSKRLAVAAAARKAKENPVPKKNNEKCGVN